MGVQQRMSINVVLKCRAFPLIHDHHFIQLKSDFVPQSVMWIMKHDIHIQIFKESINRASETMVTNDKLIKHCVVFQWEISFWLLLKKIVLSWILTVSMRACACVQVVRVGKGELTSEENIFSALNYQQFLKGKMLFCAASTMYTVFLLRSPPPFSSCR